MPRRRASSPPSPLSLPGGRTVYRTYTIIRSLSNDNEFFVVKDGVNIVTARTEDEARASIDSLFPSRNPARQQRRTARGRVPGVRRNPTGGAHYETTIGGLKVRYFQGYAEDIRYKRAADDKHYSHIVETDAAELYLCEHTIYGKCLLIVDPSGRTSLWE